MKGTDRNWIEMIQKKGNGRERQIKGNERA
jgi:hypothetical protein